MTVFWILALVMTAIAVMAVLWPLSRSRDPGEGVSDAGVYRAQLDELERDVERGLLSAGEAEAARIEAARRLLKAGSASAPLSERRPLARRLSASIALVLIPLMAFGLYALYGAAGMQDRPLAARLTAPVDGSDMPAMVARVERHLADNPEDGRGWEILAPIYVRMGRIDDAVTAYRATIRLNGATPDRYAALGEVLVMRGEGVISREAREAFEAAISLDPGHIKSRFYLASALTQEARYFEALEAWQEIARRSPPEAPWMQEVDRQIASLRTRIPTDAPVRDEAVAATAPTDGAAPGPTASDVAAAAGMSEDERAAMVEGMVARLAARLEAAPDDIEGWERLINAYVVLGRPEDARTALERARSGLSGNQAALERLALLAERAGLAN